MRDEEFEWDDRKAIINERRHRIAFGHARRVFADPQGIDGVDPELDEMRFSRLGLANGFLLFVVYTERGGRIRIISARMATKHEQDDYVSQNR